MRPFKEYLEVHVRSEEERHELIYRHTVCIVVLFMIALFGATNTLSYEVPHINWGIMLGLLGMALTIVFQIIQLKFFCKIDVV